MTRAAYAAVAACAVGLCPAPATATSPARTRPRIQLLSLAYGRFRPRGAPRPYLALRLRTRVTGVQLDEIAFQEVDRRGAPNGFGGSAQIVCLARRRRARVEATVIPVLHALSRGTHRFRITAYAGPCGRRGGGPSTSRSRVFRIRVHQPPK